MSIGLSLCARCSLFLLSGDACLLLGLLVLSVVAIAVGSVCLSTTAARTLEEWVWYAVCSK